MFKKILLIGAALLSTSAVLADNGPAARVDYRTIIVHRGQGMPFTIQVPVTADQPYALTGNTPKKTPRMELRYVGQSNMIPVPTAD
jgi:hypothetical protein